MLLPGAPVSQKRQSSVTNKEGNGETRRARMGRKQVIQGTEGREQGAGRAE